MKSISTGVKPNRMSALHVVFFLILTAYLIFSFSVARDFGITWDEPSQRSIGASYSNYVHGKNSQIDLPYEDLKYYGPFFEILNYDFGMSMMESFRMDPVVAFHVLPIVTAAVGLYFFFRLISLLFDEQIALFASAFWIMHPILFAHSQYNSKEIPVIAGFIIVFYLLSRGFFERRIRMIAGAGAVFGLVLATRIDALFLLPVFFLAYAIHIIFELKTNSVEEWGKQMKKDSMFLLVFLGTSALFLYAGWPALWKNPKFFFGALNYFFHHSWPGHVLYFGNSYVGTALPWHYAIFHLFATTSVVILLLAFAGLVLAIREFLSGKKMLAPHQDAGFAHSLIFFWIFIRLIFGLFPRFVKYDGIRHFMIMLPPILVLAGIGFVALLKYLEKKFGFSGERKIKLYSALILLVLFWLLVEFFWIFPFGGSYYNEAARLAVGANIEKKFDFEYWGASYRQGMDWLNGNAAPDSSFCVPIASHLIQSYPIRADLSFDCSENTNYLILITRWTHYPHELDDSISIQGKNPIYAISRYGSDLLQVYKLK